MQCPHCCAPLKKVNDYIPPTCGKSECQKAAYRANMERIKPKRRKLQPKDGALKADGTKWKKVPGGLEMVEIPVPTPTSNEYIFARLLVEVVGHVKFDYALMSALADGLGSGFDEVSDVLTRAETVVSRVKNKHS